MIMKNNRAIVGSSLSLTRRLAFSAIIAALSVVFLYIGCLTSVLDLSAAALCALLTMLVVVEIGQRYAWLTVAVAGVLSLLVLPDKLVAVEYIFLGGIYPVMKAILEKLPYWFAWLAKLSLLDTMLLVTIALSKLVFFGGESDLDFTWLVLLLGTLFFILYDVTLSTCITAYITRLRKRLGLRKLF